MIEQIASFLRDRPAISVSAIEREAEIPRNSIQNYMNGTRETWAARQTWTIIIVLCKYGFEANGWKFTYNEQIDAFFIERRLDKRPKVIERKENGRSWFEYHVPVTRHMIETELDLIAFFNRRNKRGGG